MGNVRYRCESNPASEKIFKIRALRLLFYGTIKMLPLVTGNEKATIKRNPVSFKKQFFFNC